MSDSSIDFEKINSDSTAVGEGTSYNSAETNYHHQDISCA